MERLHIAYLLMALMVIAAGSGSAYRHYNSPERTYRRRLSREKAAHLTRMAARTAGERPVPQMETLP